MTLKEFRESYHNVTNKASDIARATNYSLIAVVWLLCEQDKYNVQEYKYVLLFLLCSLAIDYLQYLIVSVVGAVKYRIDENKVEDKSKIDSIETTGYPEYTPYVSLILYILKFIATFIAVMFLLFSI